MMTKKRTLIEKLSKEETEEILNSVMLRDDLEHQLESMQVGEGIKIKEALRIVAPKVYNFATSRKRKYRVEGRPDGWVRVVRLK
jgi:hypothetical protein